MDNNELVYNYRYNDGAVLKRNLRSNMLRRFLGQHYAYQNLPSVEDDRPIYSPGPLNESVQRTLDDDAERSLSSEPGILSDASAFLFGDSEYTWKDRFREGSLVDAYRLWHEKRLQAELGAAHSKLADLKQSLDQIDEAERYADLMDSLRRLRISATNAYNSGNQDVAQQYESAFKDILKEINDLQEKIKTDGKKSDVFLNLFFDPEKAGAKENVLATSLNLMPDRNIEDQYTPWGIVASGTAQAMSTFANWFISGSQAIDKIIHPESSKGNFTRRAIKNTYPEERWTDSLFEGYQGDYVNGQKNTQTLRNRINQLRQDYQRQYDEQDIASRIIANKYKNGAWFFDPQKINPKFREIVDNNDSGLIGGIVDPSQWALSLAETGSSYSDIENMGGMMLTDAGIQLLANRLGTFAMRRSPVTAALAVVGEYNRLRSVGKWAEAAKMAKLAQRNSDYLRKTANAVQNMNFAAGSAEQLVNLYFINRMREHETGAEVMDAWTSRVLDRSMKDGADMKKVLTASEDYLNKIGIDTTNMNQMDLVQHALAYDIPTGDESFEKEKEAGRSGLLRVYNDNMSLAVKDYLEVLPFMSYTKQWLRSIGTRRSIPSTADEYTERLARSWYDNEISRVASSSTKIAQRFSKNEAVQLKLKHSFDFLKTLAKARMYTSTLEGIEEGQQELLQSRYGRGEYDSYNEPKSILSPESILNDTKLAWEAVLSYFGLNFGDPDNGSRVIRRAMQIGAATGFFMGGMGAVRNLLPSTGEDNIRNLIAQFKNDKIIASIIGESEGKARDDEEIGLYLNAFQKHGVNPTRMKEALEEMKAFSIYQRQNNGSYVVSEDFINNSIDLLEETYRQYTKKDEAVQQILNELNIKPGSEKYNDIIKLAVRYNIDAKRKLESVLKDQKEYEGYVDSLMRDIYWQNYIKLTDEQKQFYQKIKASYEEYAKKRKEDRKNLVETLNLRDPDTKINDTLVFKTEDGYMNPAQINKKIDELISEFDSNTINRETFFRTTISNMAVTQFIDNAEQLLRDYSDMNTMSEAMNGELGLDIQVGKQKAIIKAIQNYMDLITKQLDPITSEVNQLIDQMNATKKGKKINKKDTINKIIKEKYGALPNSDELNKLQQRIILNRAVYDVAQPLAAVFNTGRINPIGITDLLDTNKWSSLSDKEKSEYAEKINKQRQEEGKPALIIPSVAQFYNNEQKEKLAKLRQDEENLKKHYREHTSQDDDIDIDVDEQNIMLDAAKHLIEYELAEKQERKRIAHREFLERNVSDGELADVQESNNKKRQEKPADDEKPVEKKKQTGSEESRREQPNQQDNKKEKPLSKGDDEKNTIAQTNSDEDRIVTNSDETVFKPGDLSVSDEEVPGRNMSQHEKALRERLGMEIDKQELPKPKNSDEDRLVVAQQDEDKREAYYDKQSDIDKLKDTNSDESPIDTQDALDDNDRFGSTKYDDFLQSRNEQTVQNSDQIYTNYLSQTFKYDPYATTPPTVRNVKAVRDENGNPVLDKNGKPVFEYIPVTFKNNGVLRTGAELSKKLLIPGWFESADKYFIVTADESTVQDIKNPDNLVVCMVIQDGQDVYCTFMEGLEIKINYKGGILSDGVRRVTERMKTMYYSQFTTIGDDYVQTTHVVKNKDGSINKEEVLVGMRIVFVNEYRTKHLGEDLSKLSEQELWEKAMHWYNGLPQSEKDGVDFSLRKFLSGNRPVFSNQKIRDEINALRETRNGIINAITSKDKYGRYILSSDPSEYKIAKPLNPRITGGKINEQRKEEGGFYFRNPTDGGFGMSTDIEELTRQIEDEEVKLGVGLGERSYSFVPGEKAPIAKLDPDSTGNYSAFGYGHAGKIYFIATTAVGDQRAVQLFEKKFKDDIDDVTPEDIDETFNDFGEIEDGEVPTISEFILHLVTNRISNKVFEGIPVKYIRGFKEALLDIIVHAHPRTWVPTKQERKFKYYAKKQFFFDEESGNLIIALPDQSGTPRHASFKIADIINDEDTRKIIIAAISNNLHWNTDREIMVSKMPVEILEPLREYFKNNPDATEYKVAGIDDLTFKKSDFFNDDLTDKKTSVVAWMLSSGKLLTSVGDTIFDAPFVYADGAVLEPSGKNAPKELKRKIDKSKDHGSSEVKSSKLDLIESRLNKYNAKRVKGLLYIQDKDARKKLLEGKQIDDFAILDVDAGNSNSADVKSTEDIEKNLKDSVQKYIQFIKTEYGIEIQEDSILYPDEDEYDAVSSGQALFTGTLTDDKQVLISVDTIDEIVQMSKQEIPVSGVFSVTKTDGTLDAEKAKQWINDTLGLSKSQVVVTDAVLKSLDNKKIYGLVNVYTDTLNEVLRGVIFVRSDAGRGVHYHEAFHYINLLLHTKEQRLAIYKEYKRLHPEAKGLKNKDLEELLAEDFRMYCEEIEDFENAQKTRSFISRFIHKVFRNIVTFIRTWSHKDLIQKLYRDIHSGQYKNMDMDEESLREFMKMYPSGAAFQPYIPGNNKKADFDVIQDARTFFTVAESIAHQFLDFANIKSVRDISRINGAMFDKFFTKLQKNNIRAKNPYIRDAIKNPDAFLDAINSLLRRYGVTPKTKKEKENTKDTEDTADAQNPTTNEIAQLAELYDNYTISKKDNVAFRAKLFLCQIKDSQFEYDESTGQNVLVWKTNPITGLQQYVSYDDAWQLIVHELHNVDSYQDILNETKRLSATKPFFAQLYNNLQQISGDTELETQIFNTVNKHLTKVLQLQVSDKSKHYKKKLRYSDGMEASDDLRPAKTIYKEWDQNRRVDIINDNTLKAKKMLPRDWSKDLFVSPLVEYSGGVYQINQDYVKILQNQLALLKSKFDDKNKLSDEQKSQVVDETFPILLDLLNKMAIPFDDAVLTEYILMHTKGNSKYDMYEGMKEILQDPNASSSKSANISFFINTVFKSRQDSEIKINRKKIKSLNISGSSSRRLYELYEGFGGEMDLMATAYNNIHPSSRELSITGPGNNLIYPVGENNFMSDIIRWINKNHDNIIQKLQNTPYAKNSKMLEIARILSNSESLGKTFEFKLNVFVGMQDEQLKKGVDYFGINSLEDVISKLLIMNRSMLDGRSVGSDMIVLPTMADKKTYYAIELVNKSGQGYDGFNMPHDLLINKETEGYSKRARRFSDETLEQFAGYFDDELNSIEQYYKKENIAQVVKNKLIRKKNFHGKVKNGKMDFSGNGGKFRYFYGLKFGGVGVENFNGLNLNQILEYEYIHQQELQDPEYGVGRFAFREDDKETDGFELVRQKIKEIKQYFSNRELLYDAINEMLFQSVDDQLQKFSAVGESQLIKQKTNYDVFTGKTDGFGYVNRAIPMQLINAYKQKFINDGRKDAETVNIYSPSQISQDIILSVIGNYTIQSMISIIEIEKIFAGDPAFYKWNYSKKPQAKIINGDVYYLQNLIEKDTDKIKRLGALLSPGSELRTDFSEEDYKKYPWLRGTKYVNATVKDVVAKSIYLDELNDYFKRQMVADILRESKTLGQTDYNNVKGENISSKGSDFAKLLTNYGNDVEVEYRGKKFRNAEHAYQTWKSGEFDEVAYNSKAKKPRGSKEANTTDVDGQSVNYHIMEEILTEKLKQHPELVKGISERGGAAYLYNSTHDVVGDKYWESSGKNKFMHALQMAFINATSGSREATRAVDETRNAVLNQRINDIYTNEDKFKEEWNNLKKEQQDYIIASVKQQIRPYTEITVSDAQVLVNPQLYRKIRMMLGQWSVKPIKIKYKDYDGNILETEYSDNEAFEILENDPDWMFSAEKAAKVSRLQLFPLKMTYFKNDPRELNPENNIAYGLYNKMAIFPAFKFLFRSKTGKQIYNRMTRESDPIGMLTFESAVKVGLNNDIYSPYDEGVSDLSKMNEGLEAESGCTIDKNDNETWSKKLDALTVEVQDLRGLRMQLNTEAHTDEERSIGTQMFKILFGNIYDDEDYVIDKEGRTPRKGKEIRDDIMKCIKALTAIGAREIKKKFYKDDLQTVDKEKVLKYLKHVIENNNVSSTVYDILSDGGTIESLMQRTLFEHSVSSLVNSHVIDIETKGGSAIQQSVFGFVSYGSNMVRSQQPVVEAFDDVILNDGRELNWNEKDGSMEVMLSMNFFKAVVPKKYQHSYKEMRNWLINHDVIKGWKAASYTKDEQQIVNILDTQLSNFDTISPKLSKFFEEHNIKTVQDIIDNRGIIQIKSNKSIKDEIDVFFGNDLFFQYDINLNTIRPEKKRVMSNPKPFGVGYRIPTQGLSSTFAFTVADVLPSQFGDLIIVPREFTAQTGSDFDVDKLFLATMSYEDGKLETVENGDLLNATKGAIANRLLSNYIDVVTDIKNRANARASIDVVTNIIKSSTLPAIRGSQEQYPPAMYELTPFFQLRRKQEFSIGKSGIGPFALNITNLALTQFAHISLNYKLPFKMGSLDEVVGEDGIRISDWLSAMVNAHVDVAKDPYVFDLNINAATYKFANLLLRAGKGESTFLFLAQPALKEFASKFNNSGGLYGSNLYDEVPQVERYKLLDSTIDSYFKKLSEKIEALEDENAKNQWRKSYKNLKNDDIRWNSLFDKNFQKRSLREKDSLFSLGFQIMSLKALKMLDDYAQELSDLVTVSRIDTKKFGNTIALQRDFINEYQKFKYGNRDVSWINTQDDPYAIGGVGNLKTSPLERYFTETFLEQKLYTAVRLTRDILSTQSITASKVFGDLINSVFCEVLGRADNISTDNQNNLTFLYNKIYDKKIVQALSDAAENIIRHRLLSFYGPKVYKKISSAKYDPDDENFDWREFEKQNGYCGPIDFTFGGDDEQTQKEYSRLMFGDPTSDDPYERLDIFSIISNYMNQFENIPQEARDKLKGIVDPSTGKIINEILNYLKPQPANDKFSIPQLLLRKTNRNTFVDEKNKLISSFYELLTMQTPTGNIRRMARDLALYSYYSQYNINSPYSFFDLVPKEYREQYDKALALGVQSQDGFGAIVSANENESLDYSLECKNLLDSMCRNFYTDDNIVPLYEIKQDKKNKSKLAGGGQGEIVGANIFGTKIPSYILTTRIDNPFVKINVEGDTILYKKRMYIVGKTNTDEDYGATWYLYMPDEKLGVHEGNTNQYELHVPSRGGSIFEENKLPAINKAEVSQKVSDFIQRSQEKVNADRAKVKNPTKILWVKIKYDYFDRQVVTETEDIDQYKDIDSGIKDDGVYESDDASRYITENSTDVIDVSYDDAINELSSEDIEQDGSYGFVGSPNVEVTEKEVEQYIEDQTSLYENSHQITDKDQLDQYKNSLKNTVSLKDNIIIQKYETYAQRLFDVLQNAGVQIENVYFEDSLFGRTARRIYNNVGYDFINNVSIIKQAEIKQEQTDTQKKEPEKDSQVDRVIKEETSNEMPDLQERQDLHASASIDDYREKRERFDDTDRPISTGRVQGVTAEMLQKLKELQQKQATQDAVILSQSQKDENGTKNSEKC